VLFWQAACLTRDKGDGNLLVVHLNKFWVGETQRGMHPQFDWLPLVDMHCSDADSLGGM